MVTDNVKESVNDDFEQIWLHYTASEKFRIHEPAKAKHLLRTVHRFAIVSSILNKSIPRNRSEHRRVFLTEFSSDAIHLMHALLVGDVRGGRFYFRSVVENTWRHVYYKDHPVEYRWLNSESQIFSTIDELRSYCSRTDEIDVRLKKSLHRIASGYQKLSKFVHSSNATNLQLQKRLADIRLRTNSLEDVVSDLRSFGRDLILIHLVLHALEVEKLHPFEKNFAVNYLDSSRKQLRLTVLS